MNGGTTMLRTAALVMLVTGCGRLNFADLRGDGSSDSMDAARSLALPSGGQFIQIATSPDGTWYATSALGGAFRSADQGATWTRCAFRIGRAIAVTTDNTVWMAGKDIGRSTDHCASWTETGNPRYSDYVYADGATVYALTDLGLRVWNGSQWNVITTPADGIPFNWMTRGASRYFIGTSNGVLTSLDAVTWGQVTAGFNYPGILQIASHGTHSYAITGGGPGGISCSDGAGNSWSVCLPTGGFTIGVDPTNDQRVLAGIYDQGIVTTNAFGSVQYDVRELSMDSALLRGETFLPSGDLLLASDRGVFAAPPSSLMFTSINSGLDAWNVDRILVDGADIFLATQGGVLRSVDGGAFTISTKGIDVNTNIYDVAALPDGRLLAGGRLLFMSDDRGTTWTNIYGSDIADGYRIYSLLVVGSRVYAGSGTRVLSADPPYTTWIPHALPANHAVFAMEDTTDGHLWAGADAGLFTSTDSGSSWTAVPAITNRINAFVKTADDSLVVATDDGIWKSNAAHTTFMRAGRTGKWIDRVDILTATLWIETGTDGVQYSRDEGATWTPLPGAETLGASAAILDSTTGQILVGSDSRGLVRVPMP